jgi:hypothetical protein
MFSPTNGMKKVVDSVGCQVVIGSEAPVTSTTIRQPLFNSTKGVCTGLMPENAGAMMQLQGCVPYKEKDAEKYNHLRWWADSRLHATSWPGVITNMKMETNLTNCKE